MTFKEYITSFFSGLRSLHVQVLGQVEESEVHTRIFGVISGCQLTFGFGQVEWTTVYLCIAGYQIDDKGNHCRDMAFEKEPAVGLAFYDF